MIRTLAKHFRGYPIFPLIACAMLIVHPNAYAFDKNHDKNEIIVEEGLSKVEYEAIVEKALKALETDPNDLDVRRSLAEAFYYLEDYNRALEEQKTVMEKIDKPIEEDYHFLWVIHDRLGNKTEALVTAKQGAELFQTERLWWKLALSYGLFKDYEGEVYAYRKILELNPDDYWARRNLVDAYMNLCRLDLALEQQKIAIEHAEEPDWNDYYGLWHIYDKLGDKENMLQTFRTAEQLFGSEKAWSVRAWGYIKAKNYESAADAARTMLEINPKSVDGQRALAYSYDSLEKYEQALEEYKTLFEMTEEPTERDYRNLGVIYEILGDKENMVRTFQKSADVFGTERSWEFVVLSRNETGDYEGAIEACHTIMSMNPESVFARRGLASAYIGLKDYERALKEQKTVFEMTAEPEEEDYWSLAIIYSQIKDYTAAVDASRNILELDHGNRDARLYLAVNLYRLGKYQAAADELAELHGSNRDKVLFGLSMLKHLLLPLLILSMLFLCSKSRRLSPFFCEPQHEEEDFLKTLMVIMLLFALFLFLPSFVYNPFGGLYWKKVFISLCLYDKPPKEEWTRYLTTDALSSLIIPAYYMKKSGIPIVPLFTVDRTFLKKLLKYLPAGVLLIFVVGVPLFIILQFLFPSEFQTSLELREQREQAIQAFSLFGKANIGLIFPFFEEFCFRGMVFLCLRKRLKVLWSIIFSALLFMASHYFYDPIALVGVFNIGIVLAYLMHKTRSLWPSVFLHAAINSVGFLL